MQKTEESREEKKKSDRKKYWELVGIEPMPGPEREREKKKRWKKKGKKKLSTESNLGPLTGI